MCMSVCLRVCVRSFTYQLYCTGLLTAGYALTTVPAPWPVLSWTWSVCVRPASTANSARARTSATSAETITA